MLGRAISHYRILDKLGEGGMGVVYKAEDVSLGRLVALKVLPPELVRDPSRNERFLQEARTASAINHPNIAQVYELGEDEGVHFIAMELVQGKTLRQLASHKKLPLDKLLDVMIQASDALAKAHRQGVVHRDLKPENIMINEDGLVKVLDFGLAKLFEASVTDSDATRPMTGTATKTDPGTIVGTPFYMSPEQAKGRPTDHRSDTFSLGVVMYEMATGERPFKGDSSADVMSAILRDEPAPISSLDAKMPLELQRIVHKSMAKRRNDRYQDIKDLWVDLRELKREVESGSSPLISDFRRRVEPQATSHRWIWIAAAGLIVLAGLTWVLVRGLGGTAPEERPSVAVLWFENLRGADTDQYFVEGMTEALITELWKIGGLRVSTRDDIRAFEGKPEIRGAEIGRRLGFDYVLTGTIQRAEDRIRVNPRLIEAASGSLVWTERFEDLADNLFTLQDEIALRIARKLQVQLSPEEQKDVATVPTQNSAAYDHYLRGRHHYYRTTVGDNELAVKEYQKALAMDPAYALALAGLADAYVQRYKERYDYDEHWLDEAKRLIGRALEIDPELAEAHESLAEAYLEEDNRTAALEAAEKAQRLRPDWDEPYLRLGRIYELRGEYRRSRESYGQALDIRPSVEGWCGIGSDLRRRGRFEEAKQAFEKASALNPTHHLPFLELAELHREDLNDARAAERYWRQAIAVRPDRAEAYTALAGFLDQKDRIEEGEQLLRGFLERYPYHWEAYESLYDFLAWWKGDYPAAMKVVEEAVRRNPDRTWPHLLLAYSHAYGMEKDPEPEMAVAAVERALKLRPSSHRVLSYAAVVYRELDRTEEALAHFERALELNPGSPIALLQIGWLHEQEGNFRRARDSYRQVMQNAPGLSWSYFALNTPMGVLGEIEEYGRIVEHAAREYGEDDPDFILLLGTVQRQMAEYDRSISTFEQALATKESDDGRASLAYSQWLAGDVESALASLGESEDTSWMARQLLIAILRSEGRFTEIEQMLERIKEPDPDRDSGIELWAAMASRYYTSMRRWDEALAVIDEAKASGQLTWVEYDEQNQAEWLRRKGAHSEARGKLRKCLESCPAESREWAHIELAHLEAALGDLPAALAQVEQAAGIYRWGDYLLAPASRLLYASGRQAEALEKATQIRGSRVWYHRRALYDRCQIVSHLGGEGAAAECWATTARRVAWDSRGRFYEAVAGRDAALRALCLARTGDANEAARELAWAVKLEPESAAVAYLAAAAHVQLGDPEQALEWLRTAVERGHQELWWARVDPDLDPLRDDPRFQEILRDWESRLRTLFRR